jgi:glutaredoxin
MQLQIYTKPGCPLCEEALELIEELRHDLTFDLEIVNIYESQQLFDRYRYRVPVIRRGGADVIELKFTLDELKRALAE